MADANFGSQHDVHVNLIHGSSQMWVCCYMISNINVSARGLYRMSLRSVNGAPVP
jgi:hypothetical protein